VKPLIGVCEWVLPVQGAIGMQLAQAARADCMQVSDLGGAGKGYPLRLREVQEGYMKAAHELGLKLLGLGGDAFAKDGGLKNRLDSPEGALSLQTLRVNIEICRTMGLSFVMLPCFWKSCLRSEEDVDNAVAMLNKVAPIADDAGVTLAVECTLPPNLTRRLIEGAPFCAFVYDNQNILFFQTNTPEEEVALLGGDRIVAVHCKDGTKDHLSCKALGTGEAELKKSIDALKKQNYQGCLFIENYYNQAPLCSLGADPLGVLAQDIAYLKGCFP
jgi:sugar phosphate isomerase/epimerase